MKATSKKQYRDVSRKLQGHFTQGKKTFKNITRWTARTKILQNCK